MSKMMARIADGVIVNVILTGQATPESNKLVNIPEGQNAVIGGDIVDGVFFPPQPFPSWTRGETEWVAPVPLPDGADSSLALWDEDAGDWVVVEDV